ncbi:glycoside hydrolase family 26 protein [Arthrobacter sp. B1805]|uniref:glycoside hydrolase family 26 protein n=1 Tax=Arthrobacter sp. B1805 TaxID=2058892 RepID=UPI0015E3F403|nr:glycosyl hydrolase [Arthrobacter sp. B1805]
MLPATATPSSVGPVRGTAFRLLLLATAIATLMVGLAPPPAQAAPAQPARITLSSTSGEPGTPVAVTGAGFPKRSKGTVVAGSAKVAITTTSTGYFQTSIMMPAQPGQVTVTATVGAAVATAAFTVVEPAPVNDSPKSLRFGIGTNGGPSAGGELDEVAALAGEAPSIVLSYKDFNQPAPIAELDAARARGAETLLTWEPWTWGGGTSQPAYSLDRIAAGDYDAYLREWGTTLATWGHPVYLRFAHEMNGDWYPWAEGVNGNGPGDYIAAYRHVHDVVASTGASNISWVWSPNVPYWGSTPLEALYPGQGYADVVALDGYNWGTSQSWSGWQEPEALFGEGLAQLRTLAPGVPIMIGETASAESGGSKAQWITNLFGYLSAQQDVMGLVWFHINKETDWRINSTTASADAFRAGLASRR